MINNNYYIKYILAFSIFLLLSLININFSKDFSNYKNEYEKKFLVSKKIFENNLGKKESQKQFEQGNDTLSLDSPWPIDGIIVNGSKNQYLSDAGIWPPDGILTSKNREYRAVLYTDGQIAVENSNNINIWISPTHTAGKSYAKILESGDFALFSEKNNEITWHSNTSGSGANRVVMESTGSLILYANDKIIWSSEPRDMARFNLGGEHIFAGLQIILAPFISFPLFVSLVIFLSLALKFSAIINIFSQARILYFFPYLAVLGFLHEGTQIRIGLALGVAIWAIIFYCRNRLLLSLVMLLVAACIHISTLIIVLIILIDFLYRKFRRKALIIFSFSIVLFFIFILFSDKFIEFVSIIHPRLAVYFSKSIIENQNSSGLFIFIIPFMSAIVAFVKIFYSPSSQFLKRFTDYSIISGIVGLFILVTLSSNVIISSRLAEILILPCLVLMGGALYQSLQERKYLIFSVATAALLFYLAARAYVTFVF